eukprot:scaffold55459_cov30-Tisochrysis_lutea.AAC.2
MRTFGDDKRCTVALSGRVMREHRRRIERRRCCHYPIGGCSLGPAVFLSLMRVPGQGPRPVRRPHQTGLRPSIPLRRT